MKTSELITKLQALQQAHGDLPVCVYLPEHGDNVAVEDVRRAVERYCHDFRLPLKQRLLKQEDIIQLRVDEEA